MHIADKKPNIVFIFADQMRGSAMGTGDEKVFTPNLDRFAGQGTRFIRAVSNTPVCSPVRASIMTGLHTLAHGLVNNDKAIRTDLTYVAGCLNESGYKCGYIGKWHIDCADRGVFIPPGPRRLGFDDYWAAYNCNHRYYDGYYYLNDNPEPVWIDGYEPFEQTRLAIDYMKKKAVNDESFCLFLSWGPPHCPYELVPQEFKDMYPPENIELRPNAPEHTDKGKLSGYYAHITALDKCFGSIMDAMDDIGLSEDTIVIFTSDHGDMLFSQDRGWKCKPWAESVIIPFIARWPGRIPAGKVSGRLVSLVDVMPTLLGLAGVPIPESVQGEDLSQLFVGDESNAPDSVFINYPVSPDRFSFREWRGIVTETHTYARFRDRPWVFYNDSEDQYQLDNLVGRPEHAGTEYEMEKILQEWLGKLGDGFESSAEVAERLYRGSVDGTMPYYENDIIKKEKAKRKASRNTDRRKP